MKVVYIHQYFKTPEEGGATRSFHLATGLVEAGLAVEMITSHNRGYYDCRIINGIKVHYLPVAYDNTFGFIRRVASFFRFVSQVKRLIKKLPRPDLFYITSTPLTVGWIGLWAKKRFAVPYIFEVRDLWPEAPIQLGVVRNRWLKKGLYYLEERIYRHAIKIVALSPGIKDHILKKVPETTIILIPNFCDTQFFFPTKKDAGQLDRLRLKDSFTIAYAGALGPVNSLHDFLGLAKEAQNQSKDWQFLVMGAGRKEKELKLLAEDLCLSNIHFYPFGNKYKVRELMAVADMAYVSFDHLPVLQTNSPNKFFDALAMGKAILINQEGWLANLVKERGLGLCHHYENQQKTITELEAFLNHPTKFKTAQSNARDLALFHFSKERAVQLLLFALDPVKFKLAPTDGVYILTA